MQRLALVAAIMLVYGGSIWCTALNQRLRPAAEPANQAQEPADRVRDDHPTISGEPQISAGSKRSSTYKQYRSDREVGAGDQVFASDPSNPAPAHGPCHLQLNLDFTNQYFYHGIIQQDDGPIIQPAARLTINLHKRDDFTLDAFVGTWNSLGRNSGSNTGDLVGDWYESDLTAGVAITRDNVSLTIAYTFLTSPSDAFQTVQELDLTLALDDSDLWGDSGVALHPYALLGIETSEDGSDGAGSGHGAYLELGIAPGFSFDLGKTPVSVSIPVSVGLSLDDYYQNAAGDDDAFGFLQAGVKASLPLPFGDRYGQWTLNAAASVLFLGDHAADFNRGDDMEFIGTIGVQSNF